ncbi:ABC transporter ATP-binding protein [Microvirga subterranea]|uniref:ABC-2 type transport system ATP-binding protein/lipopolysaccharide transport system ATP-binding protein n=1 Tax=Microvirga subterranea TaxID=186651 RepID=A0A370HJ22_9HYPH|nr:ABC transporter ATP-binding protein [Microvirga subterranea]RDI58538.1 ABC-2 type transport system ATP-binding protein/lipopolysaccharide transport system ATP-binding protein [Microvirga subterranea]
MTSITLRNVGVDFPIYNARGRSLKANVLRRVGGHIDSHDGEIVTVEALRDINLELRSGDRLGLVGHNGAGKSTLLRVLAGAYEPSRGVAQINGTVSSLLDMTMGMDPELTGRENITLRGIFLGMTFQEIAELTPAVEEFTELGGFLELPMRTYSTGMTLRLAFAVSTAVQPDILLLDEMISVGDANFADKAESRMEQVMENSSILVLASHDPAMLKRYCNKAVLMNGGQIVAAGSLGDILEQHSGTESVA